MEKCSKCSGKGYISYYSNIQNGICFLCDGVGYTFKNKSERDEFFDVVKLFELKDSMKSEIGIPLNLTIEEYFNMPTLERYKFRLEKMEALDYLDDLIECSKLDEAADHGYDNYEDYVSDMELEAWLDSDY